MNIKIAHTVAALLVANISLLAEETHLSEVNINSSAFDAQVKSISSKQLEEEQASDVKDILKSLPSVSVAGNSRYAEKVFVRGLEDKFANITIDGAKVGGQLFHHAGDQTIDASLLKITSVELGPNSALSGPGVINGSFEYETKDPSDFLADDEVFGGKISLGYETARERKKGTVAVFGKINDKVEFVGMGSIANDGTLTLGNDEKVNNKESKLKSGLAKLVIKPNDYNTIKLSYNRYEDGGDRNISGEKVGSEDPSEDYSSINRDTYTLNYKYTPDNEYVNVEATVYSNEQYMERDASDTVGYREYTNSSRGYDLRNTSLLGLHKLTYGTDYTYEEQEKVDSGVNYEGGETNNIGLYFEDEMAFDRLTLTLGARYDHYKLGGIYDGTFEQLSPKMKLKYQASQNLSLRAAYGRIFKGPSLGETLTLGTTTVQDVDTQAQTGHNYEVGLDYNLTQALSADNAVIGFNVYRYNVDDYSHPTKNSSLVSQGDIVIWGTETMFSYNKDKLGLNLSHTYTDGEQTAIDGTKYEPQTANIHVFKVGANYRLSKEFKVNYSSQFVPGNSWEHSSGKRERGGYGTHDVNFTFTPNLIKDATFNFGIANIFDKAYVNHTGFGAYSGNTNKAYEIGRNFKFEVAYKF
ncbi:TonB-dependent receptor domain-containing protein [Poseidonibacter ostreae]|uniref:TonB-dependent receptor n=1 Tax=Poseidonibacter ostreae TaxID=2654171 RepID=A0A6L4WRL7_9BACT|nr:TonB-dependent receptor [Poseidonibacter ostreae]KAB7888159.1 TonB-dependent receptor [Poseidonibacter ostreae]KAB7892066.1 TonB-dependent receptor [Poseidonibacter ostreae]MAC84870.1 TonB-dependent receptor [Arcobacter sp.]|tara:strand:- start:5324 stop:7237 length:1914 start_codon:yes stop_codon:yes gene_type:complete